MAQDIHALAASPGYRHSRRLREARTLAQAERAESQLREDIYTRRYGHGKTMGLSDFFDNNYLSWLKENRSASAYRDALSRGKELKAFFKNQPVRDISTRDCERFKSMLGKAETLRNELRSGSTVNRYMAPLSGMCKRAIKKNYWTLTLAAKSMKNRRTVELDT